MKKFFLIVLLFAFFSNLSAKDEIMQAMRDEMDRSMKNLKIENLKTPYLLSINSNIQQILMSKRY